MGLRRALAAPRSSCREPGRPGKRAPVSLSSESKADIFPFPANRRVPCLGTELVVRAAAAAGRSVFPRVAGDHVQGVDKEWLSKAKPLSSGAPSRWRESARGTPTARQARSSILPSDAPAPAGTVQVTQLPAQPARGGCRGTRSPLRSRHFRGLRVTAGLAHTHKRDPPLLHRMFVMDEMVSFGSRVHVLHERFELMRQDFCRLFVFLNQHFTERGIEDRVPNSDFKRRGLCPVPQGKSKSR